MGFIEYHARALLVIVLALVLCLIAIGCSTNEPPDTPDIEATIAAAIAKSYPTPVSNDSKSIESEVASRVQATMSAQQQEPVVAKNPDPVQLIAPTPRPAIVLDPTESVDISPTPAPTPIATSTPAPTPTPTALEMMELMVNNLQVSVVRLKTADRSGSGVIAETSSYDSSAMILTTYHVVEGAESVSITTSNNNTYQGQIIGADAKNNLALIHVCCGDFRAAQMDDGKDINLGDKTLTVPSQGIATDGAEYYESDVVDIRFDFVKDIRMFRLDLPVDPNLAGSPIFTETGSFIGINSVRTDYVETSHEIVGQSFSIASESISKAIPYLKVGIYIPTPISPLGPISHDSYYGWAYNQFHAGQYDSALESLELALILDKDHVESYLYRGMTHEIQQNIGLAISDYDKAIILNGRSIAGYKLRARFYHAQMGDYLEALKNYELALKLNPLDVVSISGRGDAYFMIGQFNQSIKDYSRAIELDSDLAEAYHQRGLSYEQVGDNQKAQEDKDMACSISRKYC